MHVCTPLFERENTMFLSIVIPAYNAEKYIADCLESCLTQDLSVADYEIICVDDGSTDRTGQIIDAYAQKHSNLKAIHKKNGGVARARNTGMDTAQGEFIWFVDADDLIRCNCLAQLKETIANTACNKLLVGCMTFSDEKPISEIGEDHFIFYRSSVCGSLFDLRFIRKYGICFAHPEMKYGEDTIFVCEFCEHDPREAGIELPVYYYRQAASSAMHTMGSPERQKDVLMSHIIGASVLKRCYDSNPVNRELKAQWLMHFIERVHIATAQMRLPEALPYITQLKKQGLYPMQIPVDFNGKKSYATTRTDLIGKTYDWLCIHSTTRFGYYRFRLWYLLYGFYTRIR